MNSLFLAVGLAASQCPGGSCALPAKVAYPAVPGRPVASAVLAPVQLVKSAVTSKVVRGPGPVRRLVANRRTARGCR